MSFFVGHVRSSLFGVMLAGVLAFALWPRPVPAVPSEDLQGLLRVEAVAPGGDLPYVARDSYLLSTVDTRRERLLFFADSSLWAYHLAEDRWQHLQRLELPPEVHQVAYDSLRDVVLLWSDGVGEVYEWRAAEPVPRRIDRSFHHRTQYMHTPFLDARSGALYAFGGYGFWYFKNLITRFDRAAGEWHLVPLDATGPVPGERTMAAGILWPERNALYVLGGAGEPGGRDRVTRRKHAYHDLWRFDLQASRWQHVADVSPALHEERVLYPKVNPSALWSFDGAGLLYLVRAMDGGGARNAVWGVDLESGAHRRLGVRHSLEDYAVALTVDAPRRRLVLLTYVDTEDDRLMPVRVYAMPLGEEGAVRAAVNEVPAFGPAASGPGTGWPFLAVAAAALAVVLVLLRRRAAAMPAATDASGREACADVRGPRVVVRLGAPGVVCAGGQVLEEQLPDRERTLLLLLARARRQGAPFVGTTTLEEALFPDDRNWDYVRKMRNQTLQNLNALLKDACTCDVDFVVGRKSPTDRRRMEYGLSDAVVWEIEE